MTETAIASDQTSSPSSHRARPELLAPARDRDCVRAAIENGADAVYFGLQVGFNARDRAVNFAIEELPDVMALLHQRGMRGYVTLNTLAFPSELPMVEKTIRTMAETGVDAVLVQDLGVLQLVRAVCPDLAIHASTQMTLTSAECINVAERLGVERIVLARELSIDEIRAIRSQTHVPLEVFVHGALCVAYSGQCLTSESLGGRSANRGQCAQACRLPFDLVCDGRDVELGQVKYLLSPQDLAAFDLIPQLIDAGVSALKIEGRLKTAEYVANVTRHYREAIDTALAGRPVQFTPRQIEEMELSFSRGFSPGWLLGNDHKRLVPGKSSANRGVLLGEVTQVRGQRVQVRLVARDQGRRRHHVRRRPAGGLEQGGRVWAVYQGGRRLEVAGRSRAGRVDVRPRGGGFRPAVAGPADLEDGRPGTGAADAPFVHGCRSAAAGARHDARAGRRRRAAVRAGSDRDRGKPAKCSRTSRCPPLASIRSPASCWRRNWAGWAARSTSWGGWRPKSSAVRWCR